MAGNDTSKLLNAYLVVGTDELKRRRVLQKLRERVAKLGDLEFNHDIFDGEQSDGTDIASACNTLPFASDMRLVEVNAVDKLHKEASDVLVSYLAAPCETTVLALSGDKLAKNTRLYKAIAAIGAQAVIDCAPPKRYELVRNLRSMAAGKGFTLTERASEELVNLVGEDTVRLDAELSRIALAHIGSDAVNEREVRELVARTSEVKPWEFVDAFAARDAKRCLALLPNLTSTSPFALITMCANRIRELMCAQSLAARGQSGQLAKELGVPTWRVKNHARWAHGFTERELVAALVSARDCERAMKSGTDPERAFEDWFLSCIVR